MKKILFATMLIALSLGAYSIYGNNSNTTKENLLLENVEALTAGERGPSWTVIIHLNSWDCYAGGDRFCPGAPF